MKQLEFKLDAPRVKRRYGPKQLSFQFGNTKIRGTNRTPPQLVHRTTRKPYWRQWCGWCRADHTYHDLTLTQEQVAAMHVDHIENICKVRAEGEDPFS